MISKRANQIGLVAHYSKQGDWAFELAFEFAKYEKRQLNIFCFSESTYEKPFDFNPGDEFDRSRINEVLIGEERKLREYFDEHLGDYLDVGFKLCTRQKHNYELKSCMIKNQFQILIMPFVEHDMVLDDLPITSFASNFVAPVILVGPNSANQYHLNYAASLLAETGSLPSKFNNLENVVKLPPPERGSFHVKY